MKLSLLLLAVLAGCGDDGATVIDARVEPHDAPIDAAVDAAVDAVDAPPDAPAFGGLMANEGGEVRIEYVRFAGANAATRATAFLYDDSGTTKFFPFASMNGCTDVSGETHWPTATNPLAEQTYLNPGRVLVSGGPQTLEVERRASIGNDSFGRTHPANAWFLHYQGGTGTDGVTYLSPDARFDIVFTGSPEVPAQIFDDVMYMPGDFALSTPSVAPYPISAGQASTFGWSLQTGTPPTGVTVYSYVALTGAAGPAVLCMEPDDGSITVPAALIDIARMKYPAGGTLRRGVFTHAVRELIDADGPTGKRIDFIASWNYETSFIVP